MLAPWNKSYDQPRQHVKKQRYYLADKGPSSQSYGFSCWTIKKVKCQRIGASELWHWRRLLRVPWIARISNQSILKESAWIFIGRTDAEGEFQFFDHLMWRTGSLEKTKMLGKTEGRRRGRQRMRWLDDHRLEGHEFKQALGVGDGEGSLVCCSPCDHKESDTTEQLKWTEI